jgi:translation initiation factor 1
MATRGGGGLVYSTDGGRTCPACRRPVAACTCRAAQTPAAAADGIVRVSRETGGRGGKTVTVVRGLGGDADAVLRALKTACGAGGTVKDGTVEIQGDHRDRVVAWLEAAGRKVRRAGG